MADDDDDDVDIGGVGSEGMGVNGVRGAPWMVGLSVPMRCALCCFLSLLGGRLERVRRPKTHGSLALVHRSQAPEPTGTEHLSFWIRHLSHDDRTDRKHPASWLLSLLSVIFSPWHGWCIGRDLALGSLG